MIGKRNFFVLVLAVFVLFFTNKAIAGIPGDVDGSGSVDLKDTITVLQLGSGMTPSLMIDPDADINNDEKLGMEEAIFDLQVISALRELPYPFSDLKFNYNEDGGSVRVLSTGPVNDYVEVQESLSTHITARDEVSFSNTFELYVIDLLDISESIDSMPSYAPRGESKQLTVDVTNGIIDYSNYIFKGDINLDSEVDFTDLEALKTALFSEDSASIYDADANSDGSVDIRDMIFILARIGTQISYFDFYTTAGEKVLDISIREASDPRVVDYIGPEAQVMVVPKDINKASGFTSGLSDSADVWYKKSGWVYEDDAVATMALGDTAAVKSIAQKDTAATGRFTAQNDDVGTSKGEIIKSVLDEMLDFDEAKNEPYLIGWYLGLRYVDVGTYQALDTYGMDGSVSYIQPYEDRIRAPHFAKTTMTTDFLFVSKIDYSLRFGIAKDIAHTAGKHQSLEQVLIRNGESVIVRQILHGYSVRYTSEENHVFSGNIWGGNNNLEGSVRLYRIGPYPDEKDYGTFEVKDGNFSAPNLPYGAYEINFENKCGCATPMESSFIFKDEETNFFKVEEVTKKVTVGLTIVNTVDDADEPIKNAAVEIKSSDCVSEAKSASATTNEQGFVAFDDMPIGKYDVYVDGKMVTSIIFCDTYAEKIVVSTSHLWKFKVVYTNADYGGGTITATDLDIDFNAEIDPGGTIVYTIAGSTCGGNLSGCGDFAIYNDQIIRPGTKWVSFAASIPLDDQGTVGEMISAEMDLGMNGLVCDGHIPAGFNADSETTIWTYSNSFSSWTLTLEPCASGGCD